MFARLFLTPLALIAGLVPGQALIVPYTEDFSSSASNWLNGSNQSPIWNATGGVNGGGYISAPGTLVSSGFGTIVFRGNAIVDASGDAFVGDWLAGGVTLFNAYVRHNALADLNIYARLDSGGGRAGSSVPFLVAPNTWTLLSVPIEDAATSFLSYGQASPGGVVPNAEGFRTIFSGIQNVQIVLGADGALAGETYTIDVDKISVVPEPATVWLVVFGLVGLVFLLRRHRVIVPNR